MPAFYSTLYHPAASSDNLISHSPEFAIFLCCILF